MIENFENNYKCEQSKRIVIVILFLNVKDLVIFQNDID